MWVRQGENGPIRLISIMRHLPCDMKHPAFTATAWRSWRGNARAVHNRWVNAGSWHLPGRRFADKGTHRPLMWSPGIRKTSVVANPAGAALDWSSGRRGSCPN